MAKAYLRGMLVLLCLLSAGCTEVRTDGPVRVEDYSETIRLACIGDSITYGSGINDREVNSYPAQLQRVLGDRWEVRNFGVSGATMLRKSDLPYWQRDTFRKAMTFRPHIVLIKLGTNDSKSHWDAEAFRRDYADMIDTLAALDTTPRIYLCLPVPAYETKWEIRDEVIKGEVIPIIQDIAEKHRLVVIDLYTALSGAEDLFPDKIHPNAEGAGLMARTVAHTLTGQ
ncbi:MAG: hypothetical protein IH624_15115 [Phycisphaerae bacterium]|nr:hypothetical protein [Phycisphaerae bacterium]